MDSRCMRACLRACVYMKYHVNKWLLKEASINQGLDANNLQSGSK
jgi:hypothetical protein